jgi:hypothetical protein
MSDPRHTREFTAPPVLAPPRPMPERREQDLWLIGIVMTVVLHGLVVGGCAVVGYIDHQKVDKRASLADEKYETIEAGLAIKKKSSGKPKSKLPQKDVAPKVKAPAAPGVAMDADAKPTDPKEKKKPEEYIPPDKIDAASVFDKFRNVDTGENAAMESVEPGTDAEDALGQEDGSEFGILDKAKGDPYVGELIGRMIKDFTVPSVVTDTGLETWGCVKLADDGKIDEWKLDPDHRSKNHAFNSAVEDRLKATTDMEAPVPDHLKKLLVEQFACVKFKY